MVTINGARNFGIDNEIGSISEGKDADFFMIDLKEKNIRKIILDFIRDKGLMNHCIFSGRSLSEILLIKKEYPESKICYNITKGEDLTLSEFLNEETQKKIDYKFDIISLKSHLVSSKFIQICHRNKILALAWDFIDYSNPLEKINLSQFFKGLPKEGPILTAKLPFFLFLVIILIQEDYKGDNQNHKSKKLG